MVRSQTQTHTHTHIYVQTHLSLQNHIPAVAVTTSASSKIQDILKSSHSTAPGRYRTISSPAFAALAEAESKFPPCAVKAVCGTKPTSLEQETQQRPWSGVLQEEATI